MALLADYAFFKLSREDVGVGAVAAAAAAGFEQQLLPLDIHATAARVEG